MNFFQRLKQLIPRPFKYIQRKLDIEAEWAEFKSHLRPHKYKITTLFIIVMYPFYSSYLMQAVDISKHKLSKFIQK